jgi:hypothetical protein
MYGRRCPKFGGDSRVTATIGSSADSVAPAPTHTNPRGSTGYQPPGQPSVPAFVAEVFEAAPARR